MSEVRLAATVILARPPFEVYLTRRSSSSAFAPDAFVFPGGTVEPQDAGAQAQQRTLGLEPSRLAREFRAAVLPELICTEPAVDIESGRSLLLAALRELFEESGVVLVCRGDGSPVRAHAVDWDEIALERTRVRSGTLTFADFLALHDWHADARALTLFSHWVTPASEPRRYNTHFFFAAAPPDQSALPDAFETHDGLWIAPCQALESHRRGELHLVYPTIKHLERLRPFRSVDVALEFAQTKPVVTIMPKDAGDDFAIPTQLEAMW